MRYVALAADYDGTITHNGEVDAPTLATLERLRGASRKLILVTGRELDDLIRCLPRLDLFGLVVAENGALLYWPATKQERTLAFPPPPEFVERLREAGVSPLSMGRIIVASWEPNEGKVLATIRDMGLELQIIFNKGAVMVLPAGVNKESGLRAALQELDISPRNVVAVGDAENDFAFLDLCGMPVAVANALPRLKDAAALVTQGERGAGVAELVDLWLETDLAGVDETNARQQVPLADGLDGGEGLALVPVRQSLLLTGTSGGSKSTLRTGLLERLSEHDLQFVVMDPDGDYEGLGNAVAIGSANDPPRADAVLEILRKTASSVAVNLLGVKLEDRPGHLAGLLPELLAHRERTGRPHFVVVDEAHHMLPASWDPGATALPIGLRGFMFVTVRPGALSPRTLDCVDRALAVGDEARAALALFVRAHGLAEPDGAEDVERGEVLTMSRTEPAPRRFKIISGKSERRRHLRKYTEGKLRLRATNLIMFLEMTDGVDDATWAWHRDRGDFSAWVEGCIKDAELAAELRGIEADRTPPESARQMVRAAVERRYIAPA